MDMGSGHSKVRAVVFDLDGTLVDSLPVVLESYRRAVEDLGGPTYSAEKILASFSVAPAERMLASLLGRADGAAAVRRYHELLAEGIPRVSVYSGVEPTLHYLQGRVPMGVFTAADAIAANLLLEGTGLLPFFNVVVGGDEVPRPKPAPDGLIRACRTLGVEPAGSAYVGDGPADMEAARRCGALAMAAGWGHLFSTVDDMDVVLSLPSDLTRYLEVNTP